MSPSTPDQIKVKQAKDGSWYWARYAANNEPVAVSETYTRKEDAVEAAHREAQGAEVAE